MIKKFLLIGILLIISLPYFSYTVTPQDSAYNARMNLDIQWNEIETGKPIIPREEIKTIELNITVEIETGPSFGQGLFEGYNYNGSNNVIHLEIVETPEWCSAVLDRITVITPMARKTNAITSIYLILDENAPAYGGEGIIKIRAESEPSGLINGANETFDLAFITAYIPIIKTNLPDKNTKRITPDEKAVFPIEVENIGNARTKVFFEITGIPKGWSATITDTLILDEQKGSKKTAYLSVIPSTETGYHFDEEKIQVKITPAMAENVEDEGTAIYANFIIQNRGFSSSGLEIYIPILLIVLICFVVIILYLKRK